MPVVQPDRISVSEAEGLGVRFPPGTPFYSSHSYKSLGAIEPQGVTFPKQAFKACPQAHHFIHLIHINLWGRRHFVIKV